MRRFRFYIIRNDDGIIPPPIKIRLEVEDDFGYRTMGGNTVLVNATMDIVEESM